jgi:hypothetical protein
VFEPNYGQTDASVKFISRGDRFGLFLTETEAVVSLGGRSPVLVRMQLTGQSPHPQISGSGLQPGTSQYFKGSVAAKWQESVPHFLKVDYKNVYPGIDLTYYGNQRQLEYDFTVAPHANPKAIELKFSGTDRIEIADKRRFDSSHLCRRDSSSASPRLSESQRRTGIRLTVNSYFWVHQASDSRLASMTRSCRW